MAEKGELSQMTLDELLATDEGFKHAARMVKLERASRKAEKLGIKAEQLSIEAGLEASRKRRLEATLAEFRKWQAECAARKVEEGAL